MYRAIYRSTRLSTDIPWYQKNQKVEEIVKKFKDEKKLINENFVVTADKLVGYYTCYWIDKESFNDYLNDSIILEWRLGKLMFQSETGSTDDLISAKEIL
jgi:hypothetical protein